MQTQEKVKNVLEIADGLIKFIGFVSIAFVICAGLAHRAGGRFGEKIFRRRRELAGKPLFQPLLSEDRQPPFWKDEKLIRGGLKALQVLAFLLSYVVIMLVLSLFLTTMDTAKLVAALVILMAFPNSVAAFLMAVLTIVLTVKRESGAVLWVLTALSIAAAVVSIVTVESDITGLFGLSIQGAVFFIESLTLGYLVGLLEGVHDADIEQRLPLVEVTTRSGIISGLRMRGSSRGEYRFVAADGAELLIPSAQIRLIRTAKPENDKAAPAS